MASEESSARRHSAMVRLLVRHGRSDLVSGASLEGYAGDADAYEEITDKADACAADVALAAWIAVTDPKVVRAELRAQKDVPRI